MFERFTHRARRVIILAQEEAKRLSHSAVGPEQILLGIIREGEGVASKALASLSIDSHQLRNQIEDAIGRGTRAPHEEITFTPQAKRVLELALQEARKMHHNYIGTEHLLLGLLREGDGVAARLLEAMGADVGAVRAQVLFLLGETRATADDPRLAAHLGLATKVADATDLSPELKQAILEHLSCLGEEAELPNANRRTSVIRTVIKALDQLLANTTGLDTQWQALKSALEDTAPP
ncbi:MAG: Clp protease N-terminal domain-containing protein, partial [bacterium]